MDPLTIAALEQLERDMAGPIRQACTLCHGCQVLALDADEPGVVEPCPSLDFDEGRGVAACRLPDGRFDLTPYAKVP